MPRRSPPRSSRSYGRLIRDAYDYWFGRKFERERLRIEGELRKIAGGYRGSLRHDQTTDLFPLVVVERPGWTLTVRLLPSFKGKERFEAVVMVRSRRLDPRVAPLPVLNCLSVSTLERDLGAPWLDTVTTGAETFDARFVTRVLPGGDGCTVLSSRVKNGLLGLYFSPGGNPNLWFECQSNFVRVKQAILARKIDSRVLRPLCMRTLRVFLDIEGKLRARFDGLPGDILFIGDDTGHCKICGELVLARAVRCVACDTTHHEECFEYAGVCAIYGCGTKKYHPVISRGPT